VSQVAEAAHVTKGAVYHHFESKEGLYLAMMHADLEAKRELHKSGVTMQGSCRDRLEQLTRSFLSLPQKKQNLITLVRRDLNIFDGPVRDELVAAYQRALPDLIEEIIRDGIRDGELVPADPRLLAWQFVALVEVSLTPYAAGRFARDDDRIDFVLSLFLHGCSRGESR
jgi:AcrR family transcriptional regulator